MKPETRDAAHAGGDEAPHLPGLRTWTAVYAVVLLSLVVYVVGLAVLTRCYP